MVTEYINYFKNLVSNYLPSDKSVAFYDEFNYDSENDIKFTIKRLTGTIDSGLVVIPFQIICEVNADISSEIMGCLDEFAIANNQSNATIDNTIVKQEYTTCYSIQNFQQNGLLDKTTLAINAKLSTYGDVDIDSFTINGDSTIEIQEFVAAYVATPSTAGALRANNGKLKRKNRDVALSYSIVFIPKDTTVQKSLFIQALSGNSINTKYTIVIGTSDTSVTKECVLAEAKIQKLKGGVPGVSATFTEGDF